MIYIAADHQGRERLEEVKSLLQSLYKEFEVLGEELYSPTDDYPDFAALVCSKVLDSGENSRGILLCGSGEGVAIAANRFEGIRAGLCWDAESARLGRSDDDINILCLPKNTEGEYKDIIEAFLETRFKDNPKYSRRIKKLDL